MLIIDATKDRDEVQQAIRSALGLPPYQPDPDQPGPAAPQ